MPTPRTIEAAATALREGAVTSVALTEAGPARADRHDGWLGAFLARFDDQALARAAEADMDDDLTRAGACLRAAGLEPPEDELPELAQGYAQMRAMVAVLAAVPEAEDEPPALGFRARLT